MRMSRTIIEFGSRRWELEPSWGVLPRSLPAMPVAGVAAADVATALCAALGCREGQFILPAPDGEPYLSAPAGVLPPDCVWNLSFD